MRTPAGYIEIGKPRGSILAVTLFLCMLAAISSIWMVKTLFDHQKTNVRRRDINRAYFAAEAGIAQVLHWGNYPDDYDSGGTSGLFYRDPNTGNFPNMATVLDAEGYSLSSEKLGSFTSKYDYPVASVKEIVLIGPDAVEDPVDCLFKARSVGQTPSGTERTVLAYINANPLGTTEVILPAALVSMGTAGLGGNARTHWGDSWSKGDFNMLSKSQCNHLDSTSGQYDPWAKYRTEGQIMFPTTWKSGTGQDIYEETTRTYPGAEPASGNYANAFEQFLPSGTLEWPDFLVQYDTFKELAISHGRYYSTDAAGNIYRDGVEDADHLVDFVEEFESEDRASEPYDLVFIDTIDGNPPASDGSNLATVTSSGNTTGLKGVFYICANFSQTGVGTPPTLANAARPDGMTENLTKIYLDGVLYTAGTVALGGNAGVYGAVVAEHGFVGGGTPDIYYNCALQDGLEIHHGNVGSTFRIVLQENF